MSEQVCDYMVQLMTSARKPVAAGMLLTIALYSCTWRHIVTSDAAQAPLTVELQFTPMPAHVGPEGLIVYVRDRTLTPVSGAVVTILPSFATAPGGHRMAMQRMGLVSNAVQAVDSGDGVYHADVQLTRVTHWSFVVDVTAARTRTMATHELEVR